MSEIRLPNVAAALRLVLAAFVLALTTTFGASGALAHADDATSSGGEPGPAATSQRSESGSATPKKGPRSVQGTETKSPRSAVRPPRKAQMSADAEAADTDAPETDTDTDTPAPVEDQPATPDETSALPDETAVRTPTTVPRSPKRVRSHTEAPAATSRTATRRDAVAPAASVPDTPAAGPSSDGAAAPILAPAAPAASASAAATSRTPVPIATFAQLGRQLTGGLSDVGTIVVSVVHSAATAVAQAFGPHRLLGVPYLLATSVANAAAAVGRTLVGGSLHAPTGGRFAVNYGLLDGLGFFNPQKPPPGANDPSITVTAEHPLPIILVNPTALTQGLNWAVGAPVLANAGYKVYTFNYGNNTTNPNFPIQSIGDIRKSALELEAEIDRVLAETGAPQVILIGHSQGGGNLPSYYINNLGGADKVSQLIGISPGHNGSDFNGLVSGVLRTPILRQVFISVFRALAPAIYQQSAGSPFQDEIYGNGDTRPGVLYTTISTIYDEVATPYTNNALDGPNVTNIILQDRYPGQILGHLNVVTAPQTWAVVLEALAANPAANPLGHQDLVAA
ncbi:esterase/lipase family protein [Mycolicibacterium diernhoferi]|uniref:Lipase n=3 Tax=Mycolicibacterium diernhoferi TaxID=1801 RepID=A0A1Q4HJ63_9MYCO|nr:alpha/beta fold hydrolase [Mycolicibacterium diernhoferi]OJZ67512.1 lipase [Mycolicibacterium diernhoferi]PEG55782.1 lipase [Mycolicibacterium diernhoferi]QYL25161.1 lipase [Mycolicibacterium diernhoferi]